MYHGAEHKCINCVEHGMPLTVENVMASSRQHRRCGNQLSVSCHAGEHFLHFIFVLVPVYWVRLFGRLLMVPVVAGISFEMIQWAGRTDSKLADFSANQVWQCRNSQPKSRQQIWQKLLLKAVEAVFFEHIWREYLKTKGITVRERTVTRMRKTMTDI